MAAVGAKEGEKAMALEVEYFEDIGNNHPSGSLSLGYSPVLPDEVSVDPIGGPAQVSGVDFNVSGSTLTWDLPSSDIKSVIAEGFVVNIRVMYERN